MISRPGPLSLDASSRLNHRAFASVINLVPLESTIRWVSLALLFYDIEGQPSAGSVSQQRKRGLSPFEGESGRIMDEASVGCRALDRLWEVGADS